MTFEGNYLSLCMIFLLVSGCVNDKNSKKIPDSVIVKGDSVYFIFEDNNYRYVHFGYQAKEQWEVIRMKKIRGWWCARIPLLFDAIEYKFLVNKYEWFLDPLNENKRELKKPYIGSNSYVDFKVP